MDYNDCMEMIHNRHNSDFLIFAGRVIDNIQPGLRHNTAIFVRNGRIMELRYDVTPEQLPREEGLTVLNFSDLTVLPAMLDCHVHLALDGRDFKAAQLRWQDETAWMKQVQAALSASHECGLAVIRDGGDRANIGLRAKRLVEKGLLAGPRILACGQAIGKRGRYGSFLGPGVNTLADACQLLDKLREEGADWIKVLVSGIVSFKAYGRVGEVQFSQAELADIVDYAHNLGLPVMAHASSDEAVTLAVRAGVDSVEHGYFISSKSLSQLAERGIPWVPTVVPVANQTRLPAKAIHSEESIDIITRTYELQLHKIYEATDYGVPLGVGTDAGAFGVLHGYGYLDELKLYAEAGLAAQDIVKAATLNSARICGVAEDYGTIEVGKRACLIGVKGDPLQDIGLLTSGDSLSTSA